MWMDRKWNVFSLYFIYQYLIVLLQLGRAFLFFFRIYFPRSKVCLYPFVLLTDRIESDYLFSLFLQMMQFSSSSPFSVAAAPQWTDFISMLDRNKILSDQKLKIDIQPPVCEMPLLKASSLLLLPSYILALHYIPLWPASLWPQIHSYRSKRDFFAHTRRHTDKKPLVLVSTFLKVLLSCYRNSLVLSSNLEDLNLKSG